MTNLTKYPVLDQGYVRLVATSLPQRELLQLASWTFRGSITDKLLSMPILTAEIKAPIALISSLTQMECTAMPYANMDKTAYLKSNETDIRAPELATSVAISNSINQVLSAAMVNKEMYVKDGCDGVIAGLVTPVAAYWEGLISAKLDAWLRFTSAKGAGRLVREYQEALRNIFLLEYVSYVQYEARSRP
jgi:hypothetical protein